MGEKLLFLAGEFPYPPVHGGRADTWQRLRALSGCGAEVQLLCWTSARLGQPPTAADLAVVNGVVAELHVLRIGLGPMDLLWRLLQCWRTPSHASARLPRGKPARELLARIQRFDARAIWIDSLWPAAYGRRLSTQTGWPYYYRSHNVEYRYMAGQAARARSLGLRLRLLANQVGLQRFERQVVLQAEAVYDISTADLAWWQTQGLQRGHWLPPVVQPPAAIAAQPASEPAAPGADVTFIGNLHTPNNVEGLRWLLHDVWPLVRAGRPTATALIAGSAPSDELRALVNGQPGVLLLADPPAVWPLYARARVLVNPARSGSGVNVKSVEMLYTDAPIVSTPVGVGGLPQHIQALFAVAKDAAAFASAILQALSKPVADLTAARAPARRLFGPAAAAELLATISRRKAASP